MTDRALRAVDYTRVSSKRQAEKGLSLGEQQRRNKAYIEYQGWEHAASYVEPAVSGKVPFEERRVFRKLLANLDGIDRVVIPKLDRLGRSAREMLTMMDRLESEGVYVVSVAENIDTSTPVGRLLRTVLAAVAEFERDRISERVSDTNEARARAGRRGGARRPYGYIVKDGLLVIYGPEAVIVRRIYAEFCAGVSQQKIAEGLNHDGIRAQQGGRWHQSAISQMLANPIYRGDITHRGVVHPGLHKGIVTREQWAEADQLRRARARTPGGPRGRRASGSHLFSAGCSDAASALSRSTPSRSRPARRG